MGTTIRTTLTKLLQWIKDLQSGQVNRIVNLGIRDILEDSLKQNVFVQSHYDVYKIPSQKDLELLIMAGGRSHRPGQPERATYNQEYLRKKARMGEGPHIYKRHGFVRDTKAFVEGQRVLIRTPIESVTDPKTGYPYGVIHESKKSVLKYAFLSAWQDIMNYITNKYKEMLI